MQESKVSGNDARPESGKASEKKTILCDICGKPIDANKKMYSTPDHWSINATITGYEIQLVGHRVCLQNVDNKVVMPGRPMVTSFQNVMHHIPGEKRYRAISEKWLDAVCKNYNEKYFREMADEMGEANKLARDRWLKSHPEKAETPLQEH